MKKVDKLVTGLIVGGAVVSIVGLRKTKKGKNFSQKLEKMFKRGAKKGHKIFGKILVKGISLFRKK